MRSLAQGIRLSSPDCFSPWEGGVWGQGQLAGFKMRLLLFVYQFVSLNLLAKVKTTIGVWKWGMVRAHELTNSLYIWWVTKIATTK